jgi:hypothetical protein
VTLSSSAASAARLGVALAAPPVLPRHVLAREVLYNVGRAAHQVSMLPLAAHAYAACLATAPPPGFYDEPQPAVAAAAAAAPHAAGGDADHGAGAGGSGSGGSADGRGALAPPPPSAPSSPAASAAASRRDAHARLQCVFEGALNPQREAAYNLTLLLRRAGNASTPGALAVLASHLTYA